MRDVEAVVREDLFVVEEDIKIDGPRALVDQLLPSQSALNRLDGIE